LTTIRKKIAQMLIMGFEGCDLESAHAITPCLSTEGLGGVLLFDYDVKNQCYGKNILSKPQIKKFNQQLAETAAQDLPLFIAIDYEGGSVDRLKYIDGCMSTLDAEEYSKLDPSVQLVYAEKMAETLADLGFNLNFAPVVDLNLNQKEGIIGKLHRSFSSKPEKVIEISTNFVKSFAKHDITCCYKHFPGHGSAVGDTHLGFVDVSDTFQESELKPYSVLLKNNQHPAMVMTAHVINKKLDPQGIPATLSHKILTGILREKIGFNGVIISDDLQMQAISNSYSLEEALELAINAGTDMIIIANQLGSVSAMEVVNTIESMLINKKIDVRRIEEAYQRIVRLKTWSAIKIKSASLL
jgi:beta-N-acetylhexosaminidase